MWQVVVGGAIALAAAVSTQLIAASSSRTQQRHDLARDALARTFEQRAEMYPRLLEHMLREQRRIIFTDRIVTFEGDEDETDELPDRDLLFKLTASAMAFGSDEVYQPVQEFERLMSSIWSNIAEYRDIREARKHREAVAAGAAAELRSQRPKLQKELARIIDRTRTQIAVELRA